MPEDQNAAPTGELSKKLLGSCDQGLSVAEKATASFELTVQGFRVYRVGGGGRRELEKDIGSLGLVGFRV